MEIRYDCTVGAFVQARTSILSGFDLAETARQPTSQLAPRSLPDLIRAMPKVELHVHLEGAIRGSTFRRLARREGVSVEQVMAFGAPRPLKCRSLSHFIELFQVTNALLRSPDDFETIARELGEDAAAQGTRYLEVTFTAAKHVQRLGIPYDELLHAVSRGAETAQRTHGVRMRFILDHVRSRSLDECFSTAEWCVKGRKYGVVGMGLAGIEQGTSVRRFKEAIAWAKAHGVPFVPHAGEELGPRAVWEVLEMDPRRIGHGLGAVSDSKLVQELIERNIPLELCPTSNVMTRNVSRVETHPARKLWNSGVRVSLNTDDPGFLDTDMSREYLQALRVLGFAVEDLAAMSLMAVEDSLLSVEERLFMAGSFSSEFERLGIYPTMRSYARDDIDEEESGKTRIV